MPCDDITEILELNLDSEDRVAEYKLMKKSCGRAVGEASLLLDWIKGQNADHFLKSSVDDFLDEFRIDDETEEFLYLKHFFALKCSMGVLVGDISGSAESMCKVESLAFDNNGTELIVQISINAMTEKIKSCGRCQGCGSKKKASKKLVASS